MRGTSPQFACRRALEEYKNVLSLLTEPRRLTVAICHHPLIAPFPDISERWLLLLKSALESARDGTLETPNLSAAYTYIPPEVGTMMSADRVAVAQRLRSLHLDT